MSTLSHLFSNAPDELLDQIGWLNSLISKTKARNPNNPGLNDWEKHQAVLNRAFSYMHDIKIVNRENTLLKDQNEFLIERYREMQAKLSEYETVIKLKAEGRFEEIGELCSEIVSNAQYYKDLKNSNNENNHESTNQ